MVVEQSQESMVLQVSDDSVNNQPMNNMVMFQPPGVPLQPPLHIGQVLTIFGPVLPPDMLCKRSFEKIMPSLCFSEIPKLMFKSGFGSLLLSSKYWDDCFNGLDHSMVLSPVLVSSSANALIPPMKRPVARALCFHDISEPIFESFEFTAAPKVTLKRERKQKATALVDTEVRRSARLSALRDGYRLPGSCTSKSSGLNRYPHTPKKCKTNSAQSDGATSVPPPTSISELHRIGARLRIAPEKISADKLVANPAQSTSSKSSDV